jgi:hypothetical protein
MMKCRLTPDLTPWAWRLQASRAHAHLLRPQVGLPLDLTAHAKSKFEASLKNPDSANDFYTCKPDFKLVNPILHL